MKGLKVIYERYTVDIWKVYSWYVKCLQLIYEKFTVDILKVYSWYMKCLQLKYKRFTVDIWKIYSWYMIGLQLIYERFTVDIWKVYRIEYILYVLFGALRQTCRKLIIFSLKITKCCLLFFNWPWGSLMNPVLQGSKILKKLSITVSGRHLKMHIKNFKS